MSTSSHNAIIAVDDLDCLEEEVLQGYTDRQDFIQRTPWWLISVVFHAAVLLLATMIVVAEGNVRDDISIFEMDVQTFKKPEYDPSLKRDIKKSNKNIKGPFACQYNRSKRGVFPKNPCNISISLIVYCYIMCLITSDATAFYSPLPIPLII